MDLYQTPLTRKICQVAADTLAIASLFVAISACATSRMGEAEVRIVDGMACFAPSAEELKRVGASDIVGVSVNDLSRKPVSEVWTLQIYGKVSPISLGGDSCVSYGAIAEGAVRTAPVPLKTGTMYSVYLNSKLTDPYDSTRAFMAKFCIYKVNGAAETKLVQVKPGSTAWRNETCDDN